MTFSFEDAVAFHGHSCPGLAMGFRVANLALQEMALDRSADEELVAIVENNSCAVDAIQALTGCTFGKGNFIFCDHGKQVYTFIKRPGGEGIRIAVHWTPPEEDDSETRMWQRYMDGDRSEPVLTVVQARKSRKMQAILKATDAELFSICHSTMELPSRAQIHPTTTCTRCGEKMMEPCARQTPAGLLCIPCAAK